MKIESFIKKIREYPKAYYRLADFEAIFGQEGMTIKKSVERLVKNGWLERLSKNVYVLADKQNDLKVIASLLYQPSYLSFESVLYRYGVINQPPMEETLATTRRSKRMELGGRVFWFSQIKPRLWWGFEGSAKQNEQMMVAKLEKAVADMLYLKSRGQRRFETDEWYLKKVDKKRLESYLKKMGVGDVDY